MVENIGYWLSFLVGAGLLLSAGVAFLLAADYNKIVRGIPSQYLSYGIMFLLFSLAANTLYWQVFGQVAVYLEVISVDKLRQIGSYLDLIFKGTGIVGAIFAIRAYRY